MVSGMSIYTPPPPIATGIASSRHKPTARVWESDLPPNLKIVLLAIVDHADDDGRNAYPSQETIARKTGYSVRQVKRIVAELKDKGLIDVGCASLPNRATLRQPNVYTIIVQPVKTDPVDPEPSRGHPCPPKYILNTYQSGRCKSEMGENGRLRAGRVARPGGVVILGQDPEAVAVAPMRATKSTSDLPILVSHFLRHPTIVMSRRYSDHDTMILRKSVKALLTAGVPRTTVMNMIDKFYAVERFRTADRPVLLFSKKDIQQELISGLGAMVNVNDPVLELLMHEFERPADLTLSWGVDQDRDLRTAVLRHGMEVCFRYPELVAELASKHPGDFRNSDFVDTLNTLNEFIQCIIDEHNTEDLTQFVTHLSTKITLPKELRKPSIKTVRKDAGTIAEAVYAYRRHSNV